MLTLRFYRPFSTMSRLVGWWTKSEWVHVSLEHVVCGIPMVTEATNDLGIIVRRSTHVRHADATVNIPWVDNDAATAYLSQYWGAPYGWRDVAGFVTGSKHNFGGIQCAELVALTLGTALVSATDEVIDDNFERVKALLLRTQSNRISPNDLATAFRL